MTNPIPCEALATKAELEELRQQINELFGKLEDDETRVKDVLRDGNLTGTQFIGSIMPAFEVTQEAIKPRINLGAKIRDNIYLKDRRKTFPKSQTKAVKNLNKLVAKNTSRSSAALKMATKNVGTIGTVASIALQALSTGITLIQILGFNEAVVNNMSNQWRQDQTNWEITFPILQRNREIAEQNRATLEEQIPELKSFIDRQTIRLTENNRVINEQDLELKTRLNIIDLMKDNITNLVLQLSENKLEYEDLAIEFANYRGESQEEINTLKDFDFTLSSQLTLTQDRVTTLENELTDTKARLEDTESQVVDYQDFSVFKEQVLLEVKTLLNGVDPDGLTDDELENTVTDARARLTTIYDYSLSGSNDGASGGGGFPQSARDSLTTTQNKQIEALAKQTDIDPETLEGYPIKDYEVTRFDNPFSTIMDVLIPQLTPPNTDNNTDNTELSDVQLEDVKQEINQEINTSILGVFAGLGITAGTFNQLLNNTSQSSITNAASNAVCQNTQPEGCLTQGITNPLQQGQNFLRDKLDAITALLSGANAALNSQILAVTTATNNIVTSGWASTAIDKTLNAANFALSLHNAMMLSNNIAETLFETLDIVFEVVGISVKDAEGNDIGVTDFLTNKLKQVLKDIVGAETYVELALKLTVANRIYQAGMNILDNVTDLMDTAMDLEELTGENVAKIGNALLSSGSVNLDSYENMIDDLSNNRNRSRWLRKIDKVNEFLEEGEEVVDNLYSIADSVRDIKEISRDLQENRELFSKSVEEGKKLLSDSSEELEKDINKLPEPSDEDELKG